MSVSEAKKNFVHLHVHNSFSFKDGVGTPQSRIDHALSSGKNAVATSNHGNIADWISVYNSCKKHNLKPVLGCELYFNRFAEDFRKHLDKKDSESVQKRKELRKFNRHFTVFAKNLTGYYNIIKIHNDAWINGYYHVPISSPDFIEKHSEGVIATSGCASSEINRLLSKKKYVLSDERPDEIKNTVEEKTKLMKTIFRTKNMAKYYEDENVTDFDIDYYEKHKEESFDQENYSLSLENHLLQQDKEFIENIDNEVDKLFDWWHGVFGDNFYIELMTIDFSDQYYINQELIKFSRKKNIPIILTNDSHYVSRTDAGLQALMMLSDQKKTFQDAEKGNAWTIKSQELYYKDVDELRDAWEQWHKSEIFTEEVFWEAVENVGKLVESVDGFEIDKSSKLPRLYGDKSEKMLIKKIHEGMKERNLVGNKEYEDRVKFELKIVKKKGFIDYFLIMDDIISWTKENYGEYSVGPGRGSAAGSLINYVLGLTDVDPLKHNLLFERFLDIEREDVVDIDTDFEPRVRDAVVDYMIKKYGDEYTSSIGTYGVLKPKSAILDVARTFAIPAQETMKVTKYLSGAMDEEMSLDELEKLNPNLKKYLDKWENKGYNLRYYIRGVMGSVRQPSVHAAGVLVSSEKLSENVALIKAKKRPITAWQEGSLGRELSDLGYYKFDILGLNNLQVVNDAVSLVKKRRGDEIHWDNVNIDEKFVYDNVVQNKDHFGVFQFESNFVRKMIDNILPENFDQLAAISALLRPGPLHMGMDKEFANRKNQRPDEDGHVWSPEDIPEPIRDILEPTMGILTYQEQIMQIANRIGGFTVGETNQFRKNLMKVSKVSGSDPEFKKKMDKYKNKFVESATQHLGSEKDAKEMWDLMESFAGYGFNLSHSVSYTYVSFREYWLKAHYDPEFNVALLNNTPLQKEKKGESIIAGYLTEMLKKGYKVERPNINESERSFTLRSDHEIVWGLNWVKNLTDKSIFDIIADRDLNGKFKSIDDFYKRIGASVLNKRVLEGLVWSGALDDFINDELKNRYDIYNYIFTTLKKTSKFTPLKHDEEDLIDREIDYISISFQEMENFATERREWEDRTGNEIDNLFRVEDEGSYSCIGVIDKVENKTTKTGKDYRRITLRDESKILNMVYAWPWKCKGWDSLKKGMLIQASLNNDGNFVHLVGWTLIRESAKQKEVEKQEEEVRVQEEEQKKSEEEEKNREFISLFKSLYERWNKEFSAKRNMDKTLGQPWLEISSKYETYKTLVYMFDEEKGIPRKDVIYMKDKFDAVYLVNGEAHLYDMMTFQSKLSKVKSRERKKFPSLEDLGQKMSEDVIINKIS